MVVFRILLDFLTSPVIRQSHRPIEYLLWLFNTGYLRYFGILVFWYFTYQKKTETL